MEGAGAEVGAVALEGDADEAAAHFFDKLVGGNGELEEERGLGVEAVVLDAEPDVAPAVAEDGADDHGLGRARGGVVGVGGDAFVVGVDGVLVVIGVILEVVVLNVVPERGAEAFLGGGNGGGGGGGGGGGEARENASTESVDLGHGWLMGVENQKKRRENGG